MGGGLGQERGVGVRAATVDDMPTLLDLRAGFYQESGYDLQRPHAERAFTALLSDARLGSVWRGEQGGNAVGYEE